MLKTFIDEVCTGKREGSTQTTGSLSADEKEAWRQLRKELESVGITPTLFIQHREFIITTLRRVIIDEGLAGDIGYDDHGNAEAGQESPLSSGLLTPIVVDPNRKLPNNLLRPLARPQKSFDEGRKAFSPRHTKK